MDVNESGVDEWVNDYKDWFNDFDKNDDGKITNHEFRYILTMLGFDEKFTEDEVDTLFKECDLDNDGILVYQDFITFWKNH